jgi:hypothetical protein
MLTRTLEWGLRWVLLGAVFEDRAPLPRASSSSSSSSAGGRVPGADGSRVRREFGVFSAEGLVLGPAAEGYGFRDSGNKEEEEQGGDEQEEDENPRGRRNGNGASAPHNPPTPIPPDADPAVRLLRSRLRLAALAHLLAAPFAVVFLLAAAFLRNAERVYHHPGAALGSRRWSPHARWKLRELNELPHYVQRRLDASHAAAEAYVAQFPSALLHRAARFAAFAAGAFAALLLALTLADEELLEAPLAGRQVVWWLATTGIVLAAARAVAPEGGGAGATAGGAPPQSSSSSGPSAAAAARAGGLGGVGSGAAATAAAAGAGGFGAPAAPPDPERAMAELALHTHYLPRHWRGRAHTAEVQSAVRGMFRLRAALLADELLSVVFAAPWILGVSLPRAAPAVVAFVRANTVRVPGVGDVCSLSAFGDDALWARHGNPRYGAQGGEAGGDGSAAGGASFAKARAASRQGKAEKSFVTFCATYPSWTPPPRGRALLAALAAHEARANAAGQRAAREATARAVLVALGLEQAVAVSGSAAASGVLGDALAALAASGSLSGWQQAPAVARGGGGENAAAADEDPDDAAAVAAAAVVLGLTSHRREGAGSDDDDDLAFDAARAAADAAPRPSAGASALFGTAGGGGGGGAAAAAAALGLAGGGQHQRSDLRLRRSLYRARDAAAASAGAAGSFGFHHIPLPNGGGGGGGGAGGSAAAASRPLSSALGLASASAVAAGVPTTASAAASVGPLASLMLGGAEQHHDGGGVDAATGTAAAAAAGSAAGMYGRPTLPSHPRDDAEVELRVAAGQSLLQSYYASARDEEARRRHELWAAAAAGEDGQRQQQEGAWWG